MSDRQATEVLRRLVDWFDRPLTVDDIVQGKHLAEDGLKLNRIVEDARALLEAQEEDDGLEVK